MRATASAREAEASSTNVRPPLELWGGLECTVNRVGDRYFDQVIRTGHHTRADDDLHAFAALGLRTLRYPVVWERVAPGGVARADWRWTDGRLARLRELGIRPIVGLVHHGSGPRDTDLLDPAFPGRLAEFARAVAERYPWVQDFTPVNEPLTTARFAALYGHWYPHARSMHSFVRALVVECRAVVLAMEAIRTVTPHARLVQTEDVGRVFSTTPLAYQADYENERRWLSLDLLCGRLPTHDPLGRHVRAAGLTDGDRAFFAEHAVPPDVIGINYYVTSARFLDHRLDAYPAWSHGGNGRDRYADVEAVRAASCTDERAYRAPLIETFQRYGRPVAVTEAHLGGTREEQLRWLAETWSTAEHARRQGVDVRAVTAWSLLGAYDWDRLVTTEAGFYESGVYDLGAGTPRPTALASMVKALARGEAYDHPAVRGPGWWRRPEHRVYGPGAAPRPTSTMHHDDKPLVITGATGTLGRAFARICEMRGLAYRLLRRADLDIADPASVDAALDGIRPWAVVNTAGFVRVDDAEREAARCHRENTVGPKVLARACAARGVRLLTFSSDLVFDGAAGRPYLERDRPAPLCVYGATKAAAEAAVLAILPSALVVRTSAFFGPWDDYNFVTVVARTLRESRVFRAAGDSVVSPTYVPDLVHTSLDLLIDDAGGLWHLANAGAVTWAELAHRTATLCGLDSALVEVCETASLGFVAPRPRFSVLGSEHGRLLPDLEGALGRYLKERPVA